MATVVGMSDLSDLSDLEDFEEEPLSPVLSLPTTANLDLRANRDRRFRSYEESDTTPGRPAADRRKDTRRKNDDLIESLSEIKSLVMRLNEKVDKNENCLKDLQQVVSR